MLVLRKDSGWANDLNTNENNTGIKALTLANVEPIKPSRNLPYSEQKTSSSKTVMNHPVPQ